MLDRASLIKKTYHEDAIKQPVPVESARYIWVDVLDVTRSEWLAAAQAGLRSSMTVKTNAMNYGGEPVIVLQGIRYAIYRTYRPPGSDDIELYCQIEAGA